MVESMIRHPEQATPEEKAVVARIADWVVHRQDRLPDGTLWRSKELGGTVWPDDLYMGGVFLVRYGIYKHDQKYIDDAASNIIHQAAMEQDTDGLWFHGYFVNEKKHAPFKWGRGNGWVTVTIVETLSAMPENDPLRPQVLEIFRKQIDGLKKFQAPDGQVAPGAGSSRVVGRNELHRHVHLWHRARRQSRMAGPFLHGHGPQSLRRP